MDERIVSRALTIATDLDGNREWSRMDSYPPAYGYATSSSNDVVMSLSEGGHAIITAESFGMSIGLIAEYNDDSVLCDDPEWDSANKIAAIAISTLLSIIIAS